MLSFVALAEIILCWIAWFLAFVEPRKQAAGKTKVVRDPSSKWGLALEMVGFAFLWAYVRPDGFEKSTVSLVIAMLLAPACVALGWAAAHQLGKQWRFEAALSADHELIQAGPYRWVRHPIYTSMFGLLLATGAVWTWWPMFVAAVVSFLAGTEIRVRAEDRLLEERFQDSFRAYRSRVPAYIPFLR
jgi:protein-S-isoprenylcysteine O-methyltransferase Ste14